VDSAVHESAHWEGARRLQVSPSQRASDHRPGQAECDEGGASVVVDGQVSVQAK
jgi:hypothetical protein